MPELPDPWNTQLNWSTVDLSKFNPKATNQYGVGAEIRFGVTREVTHAVEKLRDTFNVWDTKNDVNRFLHSLGLHVMDQALNDKDFHSLVHTAQIASQARDLEYRMDQNEKLVGQLRDVYQKARSPEEVKAAILLITNALDHSDQRVRAAAKVICDEHNARSAPLFPDRVPDEWND